MYQEYSNYQHTMKKEHQINDLNELEQALNSLGKQTLPVDTRAAIHHAKSRLAQFKNSIQLDAGQGRLAALYQVSQSLGVSLNPDEVLTQVMDAVIQLTNAERGFLTLVKKDSPELNLVAARNIQQENLQREDMNVSRTVISSVIESGNGVVTTDAQDDPRFSDQESVILHALRSIMCAPLRARGNIIGVIYVDNRAHSGIFTQDDLDLLNTFANQAAVAIENARLYTQTDQALGARVAELETLSLIDQELNAQLDLDHALQITRQWALKGTNAAKSWVVLYNEEDSVTSLVSASHDETSSELDDLVVSNISQVSVPKLLPAKGDDPNYFFAPLTHAGKVIGAIIISHPEIISASDQQFLERLAGRSAAAIENARLYEAIEFANEAKSQFVSIVTHELRIPLTSIKGYTDLIRQGIVGEITDQQKEFLDVIGNNVGRMADLISDLSDISRIERGKINLKPEIITVQTQVLETLSSLKHKFEEKSQNLLTDLPEDPLEAFADPSRVVQVLTNLVSNAWKYTPDGGDISVRAFSKNGQICVEVSDTGIGISTEEQTKLFSQFFRSESAVVREQTGWGLGLNVTQRLIDIMGGEIGFTSKLDEGSTFWFTLPTSAND